MRLLGAKTEIQVEQLRYATIFWNLSPKRGFRFNPILFARRRFVKKMLFILFALLCVSASVNAQTKLSPYYPGAQSLVKGFVCPVGANSQACATLKQMAAAGNDEVLVQFATLLFAKDQIGSSVCVVFDSDADGFWIDTLIVLPNSLKFDLYMEHFMDGKLVGQAFGTVPATDPASITSTEEGGQKISLTAGSGPGGDTSWTSVETYPKPDGKTMSLTVVVKKTAGLSTESTIPATITYQIGDTKMAENLVAVRFMTDNMVKAAH